MKPPKIMYHGTNPKVLNSLINDKFLKPRDVIVPVSSNGSEMNYCIPHDGTYNYGYGPIGNSQTIYLSDTFALSWAMKPWYYTGEQDLVLCEVEIPDWVWTGKILNGSNKCFATADCTWHYLFHHPYMPWEKMAKHPGDYCPDLPSDYSWEQSYREFGSIGVYLPQQLSLPIRRLVHIESDHADMSLLKQIKAIVPVLKYPASIKKELRQLHKDVFTICRSVPWATVYEWPEGYVPTIEL